MSQKPSAVALRIARNWCWHDDRVTDLARLLDTFAAQAIAAECAKNAENDALIARVAELVRTHEAECARRERETQLAARGDIEKPGLVMWSRDYSLAVEFAEARRAGEIAGMEKMRERAAQYFREIRQTWWLRDDILRRLAALPATPDEENNIT